MLSNTVSVEITPTSEDKVKESYKSWIRSKVAKEFPDRYTISKTCRILPGVRHRTVCAQSYLSAL